jgi:hypothetical protein
MTRVHADGSPDDSRLSDFWSDGFEACGAPTIDGDPCRRPVLPGVGRCEVHLPPKTG